MARQAYIATLQIVIHPDENIKSQAEASDWFSGLLNIPEILDWGYLKMNGQFLHPTEKTVSDPNEYKEGECFL